LDKRHERKSVVVPEAKQAEETRSMVDWVERAVWTDRMLQALQDGVKGGVWFSLIDKVFAHKNLEAAFRKVRSNKGSAGVDHKTIAQFESQLEAELAYVAKTLRDGTYRPMAVKRVYIPKPGKPEEKRPLGIPSVRDRVVQTAVRNVIEPIFEKDFAEHSYGFRPRKGTKTALKRVWHLLGTEEGQWVVDADIKSYFDMIDLRSIDETGGTEDCGQPAAGTTGTVSETTDSG
jgi:RNA-directed DNA polymerase